MNERDPIVEKTTEYIRKKCEGEGSGHDWWHVHRVHQMALRIGHEEHADLFVVELATLLHDIADWKFHHGDESEGPRRAREWMESLQIDGNVIAHVCEIIRDLSFKGARDATRMRTLEGRVVQDADRLDAMGAIGIARAFAYGGYKRRELHNPSVAPETHETFEQYKKGNGTTVNHFYEKLLLLKDRMNTQTGRQMAEERHAYMSEYLTRFFREWEGEI